MDKVFDIYLAIADQPESDAYAELSLPAAPYEMRDAMDKLRLPENESLYWEITEYHAFEKLSSILMRTAACMSWTLWPGGCQSWMNANVLRSQACSRWNRQKVVSSRSPG